MTNDFVSRVPRGASIRLMAAVAVSAAGLSAVGIAMAADGPAKPSAAARGRPHCAPPKVGIFTTRLRSALCIDIEHETVTLPLFKGRTTSGKTFWYIVTESSSMADAKRRGVNFSRKIAHALGTKAVQSGHLDHGTLVVRVDRRLRPQARARARSAQSSVSAQALRAGVGRGSRSTTDTGP